VVSFSVRCIHECDEATIELAIIQLDRDLNGCGDIFGDIKPIVSCLTGAGWDLVIVQWNKNVLCVSSGDAITIFVDDEVIHEVSPLVDRTFGGSSTADTDNSITGLRANFEPKFIRVDGALGQMMPDLERSNDGLQQVCFASL
jgi:hypothetical protein